jgi:hypothetical protein
LASETSGRVRRFWDRAPLPNCPQDTPNRISEPHRIHGELTKLGVTVAPSTVWEILRAEGIDPAPRRAGPTWRQFLHAQAVTDIDTRQIHPKPVLGGLINEYTYAA